MKSNNNLRWLARKTQYGRKIFWILPFVCLMSSFCNIGISMIFKGYMDIASGESPKSFLEMTIFSIVVIIVFALGQIISSVLEGYSYSKTEQGLRVSLMEQIIKKYLLELNTMHTGEIQNRLTTDVAEISNFYIQIFGQMSVVVFTSLFAIISLFLLNWKITLIFLIIIPLLTVLISIFSPKLQKAAQVDLQNEDNNRSYTQEVLMFLPLFQVFSMGKNVAEYTKLLYQKKIDSKVRLSFLQGGFGFLNSLMSFGIFIITSAVGAFFVISGENTVGDLVAMIQLSNYIMLPLIEVPKIISTYNRTITSVKRIREIENIKDRDSLQMGNCNFTDINCIELNSLSFGYDIENQILNNVNVIFTKNRIAGIIGESGSGKSTLIKLILRIYSPEKKDMICIRKTNDNRNYYFHEGVVSYVPSENFVFSGTIKDNICMGLSFDKTKFENTCKNANIYELITSFNLKENEIINESGNNLSMGQKQRIAIARALYAEAPVIIFDEPTANLDSISVQLFTKTIKNISNGRIVVLVTHDDTVVSICDDVYQLEGKDLTHIERKEKYDFTDF